MSPRLPFLIHETPAEGAAPTKRRMLLLAFYFPPGQAAGALRWQKLARHAAARGWGLDVITQSPAQLESSDPTRLAELPPGTRVFGVPDGELRMERMEGALLALRDALRKRLKPGRDAGESAPASVAAREAAPRPSTLPQREIAWDLGSMRGVMRLYGAFFSHARHAVWLRNAGALARELLAERRPDVIVSCGPPHRTHRLARDLARETGIPYVMDMRDPWSLSGRLQEYCATPLWYRLAERYERRCVADASLVLANTAPARDALRVLHPRAAERIIAVPNGFDDEPLPPPRRDGTFVLAYAGSIYLDRDPRPLFRAAARVIGARSLDPSRFRLEFIGSVQSFGGLGLDEIAREEGIERFVAMRAPVPRRTLMELLAGATMLVSLPQDLHYSIPSKIYEYMQFESWLLALAEEGSAVAELLRGSAADVVAPHDTGAIGDAILARFDQFASGVRPPRIASSGAFSRREQAALLLDALDRRLQTGEPRQRAALHAGAALGSSGD